MLAYLANELGAREVEYLLLACARNEARGWLSVVNLGEILYITERQQGLPAAQRAIAVIDQLPLEVANADRSRTFAAAHVKAHHALSYADAFAVGLAEEVGAAVVTGDPEFERVSDLVRVRWLPR